MELADEEYQMNPYLPFCLFLAARVFVQLLKKVSEDSEVRSSLEFLLTAMDWLKRHNPLSESFLVQLTLDMRGSGVGNLMQDTDFQPSALASAGIVGAVSDSLHAMLFTSLVLTCFSVGAWKMRTGPSILKGNRAMELTAILPLIFRTLRRPRISLLCQLRTTLLIFPLVSSGLLHSESSRDMATLIPKHRKSQTALLEVTIPSRIPWMALALLRILHHQSSHRESLNMLLPPHLIPQDEKKTPSRSEPTR